MTTATRVETIRPIGRDEAERLAATEYTRVIEQLRSLDDHDWGRQTVCELWDVRAMAGHTVGMMADFTSLRTVMTRMRAIGKDAKRRDMAMVDVMTESQVASNAVLSTDELIAKAKQLVSPTSRWRAHAPGWFRRVPMKEEVGGTPETWRMSYLLDTILTRDPWMHRSDIARATGREMHLTPEHDGRIVADVAAEWARRHGQPFTLTLTGPAGGEFAAGDGGEHITIDAVEFCRTISGRAEGEGLLAQEVPF
jgi:uncharacterized protein (TIGR03083 family)